MLKMMTAALLLCLAFSPAEARHRHHRSYSSSDTGTVVSHPSGCPRTAFCGCGASVRIFGRPIRALYTALAWLKFPHASPGPGMVAVRRHHVFVIESVESDGSVVAYDPNSGGHQTRIHRRSLAGFSVRNPRGAAYAYAG